MNKNRMLKMSKKMLISFCATSALVTITYANQGDKEKRTPPKEAIEICVGQEENSQCTVTTPRGDELVGKCMTTPDNKYFACVPENMRGPKK